MGVEEVETYFNWAMETGGKFYRKLIKIINFRRGLGMNDITHHSQTKQGKLKNYFFFKSREQRKSRQRDLIEAKTSIWKKLLKT